MPVVVHLSDLHFGAATDEVPESLVADVAALGPDLVVVSGDLTQRARRDQFLRARAFLDRLPRPLLTVPGNHDLPLFDVPRRFLDGTGRYRSHVHPDLDPVLGLPGLVVVGLDSMRPWRWKAGHVTAAQADLVRRTLDAAPPDAWRVVVTHHPVLPGRPLDLVGRARLVRACADGRLSVLMAGHTHLAATGVVPLGEAGRSAVSVVAGTATSTRTRGTPNGYAVLRLDPLMVTGARLDVELREHRGSAWSTTRTDSFRCTPSGVEPGT